VLNLDDTILLRLARIANILALAMARFHVNPSLPPSTSSSPQLLALENPRFVIDPQTSALLNELSTSRITFNELELEELNFK
jgi:hypothetical protein